MFSKKYNITVLLMLGSILCFIVYAASPVYFSDHGATTDFYLITGIIIMITSTITSFRVVHRRYNKDWAKSLFVSGAVLVGTFLFFGPR